MVEVVKFAHVILKLKMRRNILTLFVIILLCLSAFMLSCPPAQAQNERPDRGLVVAQGQKDGQYFASWRLLKSDPHDASFTLLKDGKVYKRNITGATSLEVEGTPTSRWQVVSDADASKSKVVLPWAQPYLMLHVTPPPSVDCDKGSWSYTANDCSIGDVDGDGQYELFLKWSPTNERDNSGDGYTGNVFISCYKLDMENPQNDPRCLWTIDLGKNIRAGAHYTQFMVADFDGDGRAEMMCKTAPGTLDGKGAFVSQAATDSAICSVDNTKDWRNERGRVCGGQEYLTVFSGLDGHAIHTVFYEPNRDGMIGGAAYGHLDWNVPATGKKLIDNGQHGNRGERYLACVAYLDGVDRNPDAVFFRGYYTYAFGWAVSFDGKEIHTKWLHESWNEKTYSVTDATGHKTTYTAAPPTSGRGSATLFGNGNHNLAVGDVDGDGRDEIIWGSAALDDDGRLLYATGYGHGDAVHLADLDPSRPGLEVFDIHENHHTDSWDVHDARTGEILLKGADNDDDNGRGLTAQVDSATKAYYFWSACDPAIRSAANGNVVSEARASMNFRIYWDGDLQDELQDGVNIQKWTPEGRHTLGIWGEIKDESSPYMSGITREGRHRRGNGRVYGFMRPSVSFHGYGNPASNNWTKSNPCLQCDLFGDWREELIYRDANDPSVLYIYMSQIPTTHRMVTLLQDHMYRMGIAWQNVAYNQPPYNN